MPVFPLSGAKAALTPTKAARTLRLSLFSDLVRER